MSLSLQKVLCLYRIPFRVSLSKPPKSRIICESRSCSNSSYTKVTHCIFDMDGTILDSELQYHRMIQKIVSEKYGKEYTTDFINKMYGRSDRDICMKVVEKLELPITPEVLEEDIMELSRKRLYEAPFQKGAERLIRHLHSSNVLMALATNSKMESVKLHELGNPEVFALFHHKVSVDDPDVKQGKPKPDLFLVAASRFPDNPDPKNCLVFEDSMTGVKAAIRAGMQVVMIPGSELQGKQTSSATLVISSLLEFKPELFGLPPFPDG